MASIREIIGLKAALRRLPLHDIGSTGAQMSRGAASIKRFAIVIFLLFWFQPSVFAQELLIFGGSGHEEFLGCFNCSRYDSDAICNSYGMGSRYKADSIFNRHGKYGRKHSSSSPWNKYTSSNSVPVLVDQSGNFYGYFTINEYRSDAFELADDLRDVYEAADGDLERVQEFLCE